MSHGCPSPARRCSGEVPLHPAQCLLGPVLGQGFKKSNSNNSDLNNSGGVVVVVVVAAAAAEVVVVVIK